MIKVKDTVDYYLCCEREGKIAAISIGWGEMYEAVFTRIYFDIDHDWAKKNGIEISDVDDQSDTEKSMRLCKPNVVDSARSLLKRVLEKNGIEISHNELDEFEESNNIKIGGNELERDKFSEESWKLKVNGKITPFEMDSIMKEKILSKLG
jgi:hypothetical protein